MKLCTNLCKRCYCDPGAFERNNFRRTNGLFEQGLQRIASRYVEYHPNFPNTTNKSKYVTRNIKLDNWVQFFNEFTYVNCGSAYDQHVQDNREDKCSTVGGVDELRKPCLDQEALVKKGLFLLHLHDSVKNLIIFNFDLHKFLRRFNQKQVNLGKWQFVNFLF